MKYYTHFDWDYFFDILLSTSNGFGFSFQYKPNEIRQLTLDDCMAINASFEKFSKDEKAQFSGMKNPPQGTVKQMMKQMQLQYREEHGI